MAQPFFCVWLAMRCERVGRGAGKQKHNLLNVVMFLRAVAQGRHMALTTWGKATGCCFQFAVFQVRECFATSLCAGAGAILHNVFI